MDHSSYRFSSPLLGPYADCRIAILDHPEWSHTQVVVDDRSLGGHLDRGAAVVAPIDTIVEFVVVDGRLATTGVRGVSNA